jgi:GntR family transcriptional regulator
MTAKVSAREPRGKARGLQFVSKEVPLYYQLASLLREAISAGRYPPAARIPTEADLVHEYGLSRITVRQALRSLEEEGLIRREPGRGTFVTDRQPFTGKLALDGTLDDLISLGLSTSVKLVDIAEVTATPEDSRILEVDPGSSMTQVRRIRYFRQQPYSFIVNTLPTETGSKLSRSYLRQGSMLKFLEEELGIPLLDAEQSVSATLADAELARRLRSRIGAPLLFVDRVVRTDKGQPVMRTRSYYRSDIYSFTLHLKRDPKQASTPHTGWALKKRKSVKRA